MTQLTKFENLVDSPNFRLHGIPEVLSQEENWRHASQGGGLHPVPGLRLRANKAYRLHATLKEILTSANESASLLASKEGVKGLFVQILQNEKLKKKNQARNSCASLFGACQRFRSHLIQDKLLNGGDAIVPPQPSSEERDGPMSIGEQYIPFAYAHMSKLTGAAFGDVISIPRPGEAIRGRLTRKKT
jgi:hypothetical protein